MRKNKIYIFGNADTLLTFDPSKITHNDIVVMFNNPRRHDINPDLLFVANTIHPAKNFLRSDYFSKIINQNNKLKVIFPYCTETINKIPTLEKSYKLLDKIRGWTSNGANKIIKKLKREYQFIPFNDYKNLCTGLTIDTQKFIPSTGILAVNYCLNNYDSSCFEIHLAGFTFEGSPCHNFSNEKQFIYNLINKNILTLHA